MAASKVKLVGDCDGASVRGALDGFSDLPFMVGQVMPRQLCAVLISASFMLYVSSIQSLP